MVLVLSYTKTIYVYNIMIELIDLLNNISKLENIETNMQNESLLANQELLAPMPKDSCETSSSGLYFLFCFLLFSFLHS